MKRGTVVLCLSCLLLLWGCGAKEEGLRAEDIAVITLNTNTAHGPMVSAAFTEQQDIEMLLGFLPSEEARIDKEDLEPEKTMLVVMWIDLVEGERMSYRFCVDHAAAFVDQDVVWYRMDEERYYEILALTGWEGEPMYDLYFRN